MDGVPEGEVLGLLEGLDGSLDGDELGLADGKLGGAPDILLDGELDVALE